MQFDTIENEELLLKIIEKYQGDDVMLPYYWYNIIKKSDNKTVGKISARIGQNFHSYYNGNIGYEVFEEYRGDKLSYKACLMVLEIFKTYGMEYIYLTCNEDNTASYKIIEKLGAEFIEICDVPKEYFAWHEGLRQRIYKLNIG